MTDVLGSTSNIVKQVNIELDKMKNYLGPFFYSIIRNQKKREEND